MEQSSNHTFFQEEKGVDLMVIIRKLWQKRKVLYKTCGISILIGLIIAFSIPKEYTVEVTLSPETMQSGSNSLTGMAAMVGLSGISYNGDGDALNITLFPDILSSDPFTLELYSMLVKPEDAEEPLPLSEYMDNQRKPWWIWILNLPRKVVDGIVFLFSKEEIGEGELNPFKLNEKETLKLEAIKKAMSANVNLKTGVTTITVVMQDAVVAATVADCVVMKLQDYITTYRTKKAIEDCAYWEKLYKERQQEYYDAQQRYADYVDENKSLYTQKSKVEGERLQNEMNLAYQVYNQMAQQLQLSKGKIQEAKPVFAIVNPATVPVKASAPKKVVLLVGCIFVAFLGAAGWILLGEEFWKKLKEALIENK